MRKGIVCPISMPMPTQRDGRQRSSRRLSQHCALITAAGAAAVCAYRGCRLVRPVGNPGPRYLGNRSRHQGPRFLRRRRSKGEPAFRPLVTAFRRRRSLSTVMIAWFMPQARFTDDLMILSPGGPVAFSRSVCRSIDVSPARQHERLGSHDLDLDRGIISRRPNSYTVGAVGLRTGARARE